MTSTTALRVARQILQATACTVCQRPEPVTEEMVQMAASIMQRADGELLAALEEMEEGYRERCEYCAGSIRSCDGAPGDCRAKLARAVLALHAPLPPRRETI